MPKKSRRSYRKPSPAPATRTAGSPRQPSPTESRAVVASRAGAPAKVDLAHEYAYVFADLRRIAIIAVAMFVLLFVLAFILK